MSRRTKRTTPQVASEDVVMKVETSVAVTASSAPVPAAAAAASTSSSTATPPHVIFSDRTWYRLCVPPVELRLDITLKNGQCFGWKRIDAGATADAVKGKSEKGQKKRKRDDAEDEQNEEQEREEETKESQEDDDATMKLEPASSSQIPVTTNPALPSASDPIYVGVLGRSLLGVRQTADDVLYTEYARVPEQSSASSSSSSSAAAASSTVVASTTESTPITILDAAIRDFFHLPPLAVTVAATASSSSSSSAAHSHLVLSSLYTEWSLLATPRFRFISSVYPGVRLLRQDPFECLFSFICSSNNNISRIIMMLDALRKKCGTKIVLADAKLQSELQGLDYYLFPTLSQLLTLTEQDLRTMGFGYRAKFITQSAKTLEEKGGREYLVKLREIGGKANSMTNDEKNARRTEIETALLSFSGVGPKVAACIALFSLDSYESIPCDTHVWKIAVRDYAKISKQQGLDLSNVKSVTPKVMEHVGNVFRQVFSHRMSGWAHCLLFLAELKEFKTMLQARGLEELVAEEDEKEDEDEAGKKKPMKKAAKPKAKGKSKKSKKEGKDESETEGEE